MHVRHCDAQLFVKAREIFKSFWFLVMTWSHAHVGLRFIHCVLCRGVEGYKTSQNIDTQQNVEQQGLRYSDIQQPYKNDPYAKNNNQIYCIALLYCIAIDTLYYAGLLIP